MMRELDALGDRLGLTFEQIVDSTNDVMLKKARPLLEEARDTLMLSPEKGRHLKIFTIPIICRFLLRMTTTLLPRTVHCGIWSIQAHLKCMIALSIYA